MQAPDRVSALARRVNGECLYIIEREQGLQQAQRAVGVIDQLALRVMPADRPLVFDAALHIESLVCRESRRGFGCRYRNIVIILELSGKQHAALGTD